jgi:hypothetical protein
MRTKRKANLIVLFNVVLLAGCDPKGPRGSVLNITRQEHPEATWSRFRGWFRCQERRHDLYHRHSFVLGRSMGPVARSFVRG